MLVAHPASLEIISNVGIYAMPIVGFSGKEFHLLSALLAVVEVCQGTVIQLWVILTVSPLMSRMSSMDSSPLVMQKCSTICVTWCIHLGHQFRIKQ